MSNGSALRANFRLQAGQGGLVVVCARCSMAFCGSSERVRLGEICPRNLDRTNPFGIGSIGGPQTARSIAYWLGCKVPSSRRTKSMASCGASTARLCVRRVVAMAVGKKRFARAAGPRARPLPRRLFYEDPPDLRSVRPSLELSFDPWASA